MTTISDPYIKIGRADLQRAHIRHKHGTDCLCGATIPDACFAVTDGKDCCTVCMDVIEEREFRAARRGAA